MLQGATFPKVLAAINQQSRRTDEDVHPIKGFDNTKFLKLSHYLKF